MPSSMKTRQARDKLRKINPTWFDNFFKNDLKKLTQKNATANEVIRYAEDEKSNIYAYAQNLIYSVDLGGNSMTDFKTAIELQSQSFSTKHEGLFYKLIVNQRSELTNLKSNPEKPGKLPQIKSKIKAFLLATNEKEKDIIDEDVSEEDKKFKRMNNSSIIQKLKSSRLSNILKVFMALVFWDCIKIVEKEIKSKKEQAEEENKRQAQKETERRLKDKKQRQAQEEAIAEQERQRQARETAEEQKKKDDERKLALKDWLENQSKRIEDTFKIPDTIDDQSIETFFSSANSLKIELRADLGFDTLYVDRGNRSFKVDFPQIEKDALNKKLNDEAKQKITELLKAFMKKIGFDDALGELKTLLDTKDITSVSRSDVINKQFALRRKIDLVKPLFKYKMTTEWNLSTSWSEIITPAEDTCASADAFLTRQEKAKKEAEKIATAENRRKQVEAGRKALEERKKQAETHHQEIEKLIKDQEPNHAAYIKLINELFDATSPTFDEKRACELYNKLGFAECDDPEDISRYIGDIASALDFSSRCYASCVNDVKKLIAELLWLNHLAYDRFGTLQLMHGGDQYVNKIVRALLEYGGASRNKKEYKKYFDYRLAYPLQLTDIQNLRENYLNPMGTVFGSNFRALSEVLVALMPQKLIQTKTNSSNKMGNILATFEKLNDALNSIKGGNASFKIIAEAFQKISIEPLIDKIKEIIEKMKKKEKEKKKYPHTATPGSKLDGASEDGRYVPYISGSTGKKKIAGEGGNGKVGIYWDTKEQCKVAIKTKASHNPFRSKITDLPQIKSPYVAAYKDLTTLIIDGKKVQGLVMEYVHGQTCFIDQIYRLSPDELLKTCKQLIAAFEAFAKAGFCHMDLAQHFENVRINRDGDIKIIDYEDALGNPDHNRYLAIQYVLAALNAYHNGDELCSRLLEQFPELYDQVETYLNSNSGKAYNQYTVKDYAPSFDKLRAALDHLKEQKVFG